MSVRRILSLAAACLIALAAEARGAKGPVVDEIRFSGNDSVHPDSLEARMETAESGFLSKNRLDMFTLGSDLVSLETYYADLGFLTAEARTGNLAYNDDSTHVTINIRLQEGPRWMIDSLSFAGNFRVPVADLQRAVGFRTGQPFSPTRVLTGRDRILDLYVDRSFLDARVESETVRDDVNHRARVFYTITEGGVAYIEEIRITGLTRTDTSVVRRELTIEPGERLEVKDVARSQSNLYTTGVFRSIYISPDTSSAGDSTKVVTVAVVERRGGQVSVGFGYDTEDRFRVTTEARHKNLLGENLEAGIEGTVSGRRRELHVAFSQPWSFGLRFRINERAGYMHREEPNYTAERAYFGGSLLRPVYPFWRLEGGYDWSRDHILEGPDTLITEELTQVSRLFVRGTYETRDDLMNTYRGYYANIIIEDAGGILGGTANFVRGQADQRLFRKLGDVVLGAHLEIGAMRQQSADEPIPITERFFMGGQGTVRGFSEDVLGPKDSDGASFGGLERAFVQLEGRFPIYWIVGGAVFVDAGLLADRPPGINFSDTAVGAGLGFRFRTPMGIIRLDGAAPLTRRDSDGWKFTFGTSQEF